MTQLQNPKLAPACVLRKMRSCFSASWRFKANYKTKLLVKVVCLCASCCSTCCPGQDLDFLVIYGFGVLGLTQVLGGHLGRFWHYGVLADLVWACSARSGLALDSILSFTSQRCQLPSLHSYCQGMCASLLLCCCCAAAAFPLIDFASCLSIQSAFSSLLLGHVIRWTAGFTRLSICRDLADCGCGTPTRLVR